LRRGLAFQLQNFKAARPLALIFDGETIPASLLHDQYGEGRITFKSSVCASRCSNAAIIILLIPLVESARYRKLSYPATLGLRYIRLPGNVLQMRASL
jgi:hypothetical protein